MLFLPKRLRLNSDFGGGWWEVTQTLCYYLCHELWVFYNNYVAVRAPQTVAKCDAGHHWQMFEMICFT